MGYNYTMTRAESTPEIATINQVDDQTSVGPLYRVIIHNDDITPMDFVIHILVSIFRLSGAHALQVMYNAHYHGSAYVQSLPKPEAQKRIGQAHFSARMNGYPLEFSLKPELV